jgi:hypothetical protein
MGVREVVDCDEVLVVDVVGELDRDGRQLGAFALPLG